MMCPPGPGVAENGHESDADSNPEESPEYYQPISSVDEDDSRSESPPPPGINNGHIAENGGLIGSDDEDGDEEEEEEEEEARRESYEAARERAFREEELRRRAPLDEGSARRVMEAMRGVSFGGETPEWARAVPEDQWIQRLRSLRPTR
ncbi:hypothetical protein MLD38_009684 [Melastoma candidum]|uniref:Uncharacterized protein n=1 Tax=Melastoma candidum TaxID=119954 RepID=A0ACB9RYC5_9MYRT|nr:hypothetical protein MLD38_009684 [Melastoma candidum]